MEMSRVLVDATATATRGRGRGKGWKPGEEAGARVMKLDSACSPKELKTDN